MAVSVVMPQMGESVVEGTLVRWLVKEGEPVAADQPLAEISTDKVDTEIEAPAGGTITRLIAHEGETLPVGTELAQIETTAAGKQAQPAARVPASAQRPSTEKEAVSQAAAPPPGAEPVKPQTAARVEEPTHPAPPASEPSARPAPTAAEIRPLAEDGGERPPARYSPLVQKMAAEYQLDLSKIPGSGMGGRVTKRDVLKYLESGESAQPAAPAELVRPRPAAAAPPAGAPQPVAGPAPSIFKPPVYQPVDGDKVEGFTRRRRMIAEHMVFSKTHSPHVGTVAVVDMTEVMRLRESHKAQFQQREGFSLTVLPIVVAATAQALREFPRLNSSVAGDSLIVRRQINIGVAVDSDAGLVVPVIRDADQKSVLGIAREIQNLARRVAEGEITPDELAGGSFTVSNPGREGNLFGFAIINQPQVGILRMGEIKKTPVVIEADGADAIAVRQIMYLALSYDHRVIDGVLGNRFLYRVARLLDAGEFTL